MTKLERISPKAAVGQDAASPATLPGSLHVEWATCGTPSCRCMRGDRHGPYWRRFWMEDGKRRSAYIRLDRVAETREALARGRAAYPSARELVRAVRALDQLLQRAGN